MSEVTEAKPVEPTPFELGASAYREYKGRDENPFEEGSDEWHDWRAGYNSEKHRD